MAQDQLRNAIEGIRAHLQAELEAQLTTLQRRQQEVIEAERRAADAEAHERWSVQLEQVRADWASRLETELAAAAADADRRTVAECTRARLETEQGAAESIARIKQQAAADIEQARAGAQRTFDDERQRAQSEIAAALAHAEALQQERDDARQRMQSLETELAELRGRLEADRAEWKESLDAERERGRSIEDNLQQARTALEAAEEQRDASMAAAEASRQDAAAGAVTEARALERQSQLAFVERLLDSVRAIDDAASLSDVLATLVAGAAGEVPRVALLVVNGDDLQGFRVSGFDESAASARVSLKAPGALQDAITSAAAISVTPSNAPAFAALPNDRAGLAVPLLVGGRPVAVLYGDDVSGDEPTAPASWPEAVQILCRHASVALGHLTALRTTQAMRQPRGSGPQAAAPPSSSNDDDHAARRYARLLVSEIKLYNESAVRIGRENRDLLTRLRPEVERAKRLYEERVPPGVAARGMYFHQELVQTLADGDPTLLGNPSVPS
jgi:hypothetical protein